MSQIRSLADRHAARHPLISYVRQNRVAPVQFSSFTRRSP